MDRTTEILESHLDGDFKVFPMANRAANRGDVVELESQYGFAFPSEFVLHLLGRFPGVYVEAKESVWPRPKALDVGPFWSFLYGVHTFTPCKSSNDWMRIDLVADQIFEESGLRLIPVLKRVGDRNIMCFNSYGRLGEYWHETSEFKETDGTFWDVLEREVRDLVDRKNRKTAGEQQ